MAKKKPAKTSRPFATTSIASKPREAMEAEPSAPPKPQTTIKSAKDGSTAGKPTTDATASTATDAGAAGAAAGAAAATTSADAAASASAQPSAASQLSPEEFERQLEESELQLFVEKSAAKVQKDAQRQKQRLETERRLLRGQATPINVARWLPQDLIDQVLDLVQAENRFAATSLSAETSGSAKSIPEDEAVVRLWVLRQTLLSAGFQQARVSAALRYVLEVAHLMQPAAKDSIWGLDEALTWLASQCPPEELPDYDGRSKGAVSARGLDTPSQTPAQSRPPSPPPLPPKKDKRQAKKPSPKKRLIVTCDSDIEPDELVSDWLQTKTKLFPLERSEQQQQQQQAPSTDTPQDKDVQALELEMAKLQARLDKIENDVLFDKGEADQLWRARRPILEKDFIESRRQMAKDAKQDDKKRADEEKRAAAGPKRADTANASTALSSAEAITDEAERMAAEMLAEMGSTDGDDFDMEDLFADLPVAHVDPVTGKSSTVINTRQGETVTIRDFGKYTGISPMRILEEACRARDSSVRLVYTLVSTSSFAHCHRLDIIWVKAQEVPPEPASASAEQAQVYTNPTRHVYTMTVATPDSKQSEAHVATYALFHVFGSSPKEEKVHLRLPAIWRDLWFELAEAKRSAADVKSRAEVKEMRDLVRKKQDQEDEDGVILQGAFRGRGPARGAADGGDDAAPEHRPGFAANPDHLRQLWADKSSTRKYQAMMQGRMQLPMWSFKQQVVDAVEQHQVVIVCGETGCGKSTQTPAFLLEHQLSQGKHCKIYCTEPRRISALSLARRVSEELGENRNEIGTNRSLVGYAIRLESNTCRETRLVYATTGIVMRMLEGSNDLHDITHLVLDEVHERSIDTDFLLIVLKRLLPKRPDLKVVLMSATVDAEKFARYMGDNVPILNVPGRTFPVQVRYLEDAVELTGYQVSDTSAAAAIGDVDLDDLDVVPDEKDGRPAADAKLDAIRKLTQYSAGTRKTLAQMDEYRIDCDLVVQLLLRMATDPSLECFSHAILVFLPGIAEIRTLNDMLLGHPFFMHGWQVHALHSSIATEDQEAAFLVPPPGVRKVVLATNIAETGITIPDVTAVVDTGKHKESRFDERRQLSRLVDTFISRANAKQRRGRAGRVQEGICFHLFTRHRHDKLMNDQQTPEMLRLSLQDLAIRVKVCNLGGIDDTLGGALDPPSAKNIRRAVDALRDARALTHGEELTPLGRQLARLPLDVFLGKLVLLGCVFKCLDMAMTVAAIMSSKNPFTAPFGQRAQANTVRLAFRRGDSDLLTVYNAYLAWKRICQASNGSGKEFTFCRKNFLNPQTLSNIEDLKGQLLTALVDSGFLPLTTEERDTLSRLRFGKGRGGGGGYNNRRQQQPFFEMPLRVNINSGNDAVTAAVISWSFYPKLLVREAPGSKGLRNIANNQAISLHPTSVNRGRTDADWFSYYHIMQAKQIYHAHESTVADPFAIALLCGDVRCEMYAGVLVLDGNRGKFSVPDWKTMLVIKILRTRLRELLSRSFKLPGKLPTPQHQRWLDVWQSVFSPRDADAQQQQQGGAAAVGAGARGV